jgi:histidinol phosphatase-like enzyme
MGCMRLSTGEGRDEARALSTLHAALEAGVTLLDTADAYGRCRKPLPGLGAVLIERHRLDPARCRYVGHDPSDRAFARALGLSYADATDAAALATPWAI